MSEVADAPKPLWRGRAALRGFQVPMNRDLEASTIPARQGRRLAKAAMGTGRGSVQNVLRGRRLVAAAGAFVAVIYLVGVTGRWWPTPDSAVYLGLGRSIASGNGYRFNGEVNRTFAPGLPLVLAAIRGLQVPIHGDLETLRQPATARAAAVPGLAGESYWASNTLTALCGLGALLAAYRSLRLWGAGRGMAGAAMLAVGLSYTLYFNSHRILSDAPFALAFWSAVLFAGHYLRKGRIKWLVLTAVSTMAGIGLRAPGVLAVGALAAGVALDRSAPGGLQVPINRDLETSARMVESGPPSRALHRQVLLAGVILGAGIAMAGVLYFLARWGAQEAPAYVNLVGGSLEAQPERLLARLGHGLTELPSAVAETLTSQSVWVLGMLLMLPMVGGAVRLAQAGHRLPATMLVIYPLALCLCLGSHGMKPRYLVPVQPLMVLGLLSGACWTREALKRRLRLRLEGLARSAPLILACVTGVLILANGPRLLRQVICYGAPSYLGSSWRPEHGAREADLLAAAERLALECPPQATIAADSRIAAIVHYVTQRHTVPLPEVRPGQGAEAKEVLAKSPTRQSRYGDGAPTTQADADASNRDIRYVLVETSTEHPARGTLQALLADDPLWREVFRQSPTRQSRYGDGARFALYERTAQREEPKE